MHCDAHTQLSLLIRAGEFWFVSNEVGKKAEDDELKETGWLKAKVVREEDKWTPPQKEWEYSDGGKWESDPTLECSRQVLPSCTEVIVELGGEVKEKYPELAGSYFPVKEKINRGRWVGSYQQQSFAA